MFKVQADVAGQVARALDLALGRASSRRWRSGPPRNAPAYDAYLKGEATSRSLSGNDSDSAPGDRLLRAGRGARLGIRPGVGRAVSSLRTRFTSRRPEPALVRPSSRRPGPTWRPTRPGDTSHSATITGVSRWTASARGAGEAGLRVSPTTWTSWCPRRWRSSAWDDGRPPRASRGPNRSIRDRNAAWRRSRTSCASGAIRRRSPRATRGLAGRPDRPRSGRDDARWYSWRRETSALRERLSGRAGRGYPPATWRPSWGTRTSSTGCSELQGAPDPPRPLPSKRPLRLGDRQDQTHVLGDRNRRAHLRRLRGRALAERLRVAPDDAQGYVFYGLALTYLGRKAEAVAAGERGWPWCRPRRMRTPAPTSAPARADLYESRRARQGDRHPRAAAPDPVLPLAGWLRIDPSSLRSGSTRAFKSWSEPAREARSPSPAPDRPRRPIHHRARAGTRRHGDRLSCARPRGNARRPQAAQPRPRLHRRRRPLPPGDQGGYPVAASQHPERARLRRRRRAVPGRHGGFSLVHHALRRRPERVGTAGEGRAPPRRRSHPDRPCCRGGAGLRQRAGRGAPGHQARQHHAGGRPGSWWRTSAWRGR